MGVDAIGGGGLETAQMALAVQVSLQNRVSDMAKEEMAGVLQSIAPPPSHLGRSVNAYA